MTRKRVVPYSLPPYSVVICQNQTRTSFASSLRDYLIPSWMKNVFVPKKPRTLEERMRKAESIISYTFNDPRYLAEALQQTAAGADAIVKPKHQGAHRRLALVGDTVLKTVLLTEWYRTDSTLSQGGWMAEKLGTNKFLLSRAEDSGLVACMPPHYMIPGSDNEIQVVGGTVEAVIGAVWYDSGFDMHATSQVLKQLQIQPSMIEYPVHMLTDPKPTNDAAETAKPP